MEHKIENPFEWEGHEVEAMLATASSADGEKELCIVSVVRQEGPAAFYRVKERGEDPVNFENWMEAVDYYNCIGEGNGTEQEEEREDPDKNTPWAYEQMEHAR